ncbi:hypothetical protein [Streptomyces rimosus]|uniref:hypothetical protein n=1 Tax=Streptomyces rimosus TaxID=1927 RepID=UPI0004C06B5A|nr:hypothetical protein [Streptomyces rimosus]
MFRPLTDVAEVTFAAYSVTASPASALVPGTPNPRRMSGALLRAMLINAIECGGALSMDDVSRTVGFTYASGTFHGMVQEARPLPTPRTPTCGTCGQWESEHHNPNATACDKFDVEPRPDTPANPRCEMCSQPASHHGRRYTVACRSYMGEPQSPEYAPDAVAKDMAHLAGLLSKAGMRTLPYPDARGALRVDTDTHRISWIVRRRLENPLCPAHTRLRFFVQSEVDGERRGAGPLTASEVVRFFR